MAQETVHKIIQNNKKYIKLNIKKQEKKYKRNLKKNIK